jgi:hypothetical protein
MHEAAVDEVKGGPIVLVRLRHEGDAAVPKREDHQRV